jgi:hypothetical protein
MAVSPETTGFPFCRLLRFTQITVEVFLPASTQGRHRINAHRTHTNIHASSGIRTHDLSVGAGEGSSCLRPRVHCDLAVSFLDSSSVNRTLKRYVAARLDGKGVLFFSLRAHSQTSDDLCILHTFYILHYVFLKK